MLTGRPPSPQDGLARRPPSAGLERELSAHWHLPSTEGTRPAGAPPWHRGCVVIFMVVSSRRPVLSRLRAPSERVPRTFSGHPHTSRRAGIPVTGDVATITLRAAVMIPVAGSTVPLPSHLRLHQRHPLSWLSSWAAVTGPIRLHSGRPGPPRPQEAGVPGPSTPSGCPTVWNAPSWQETRTTLGAKMTLLNGCLFAVECIKHFMFCSLQ